MFTSFISYRKQLVKDGIIDEKDFKIYRTMTKLYADTVCSVEDGSMHLKYCIERNCSNCKVSSIKFSNPELSKADDVPDLKWKQFEYIDIKTKHGTKKG